MSNLCNQHNMEGSVCRHPAEEGATSLMPCLHGFKLLFEEFTKGSPFDMWKHCVHIAKWRFLIYKCAKLTLESSAPVQFIGIWLHDYTSSSIGSKVLKLTGILKDVFDLASPTQRCISMLRNTWLCSCCGSVISLLPVGSWTNCKAQMSRVAIWQCQLIVVFFLIPGSQDFFCRWCNFGVPAAVETC